MEHKDKQRQHRSHYFVVDRTNSFTTCSICGLVRERKTIGWDSKEEKI
jgi:hypothetical protein